MTTFSPEQLNFFKFSTVVLDEFPVALRQVFVSMWDNQVAPTPGFQKWDDSPLVRNMFLTKEGGKTKYVPTSKSYMEWDCTALFEATLYARSFAMPGGKGGFATLDKLYVKPRCLPRGAFHRSVFSPTGNQAETFALALDQLRLLRNSLCHQISTLKIDKATFDYYIRLAKEAFAALSQTSRKIDDVGKLGEKDFPTDRVQQLEEELRKEKFKQIEDDLDQIETEVKYVGSDVKDIKRVVTDEVAKVEEVGSDVKDVKTTTTDVNKKVEQIGSHVKDVKTAATDVKIKMGEVGSDVQDVKTTAKDVNKKVEQIGSDVKDVKTAATDLKTKMGEVGSDVKTAVEEVRSVKANVDDIKQAMQATISKGVFVPDTCIPEKIPNFVGRQEECESIRDHLTDGIIRLVNVWGPPGFGKTSVAINVAHHLRDMKIPAYFVPVRGMESKEELVSKLLSMFADTKHISGPKHISSSHWLIQCLQQMRNSFVLILDNADDLLESEDAKRRQNVLRIIDEILAQCKYIKLLLTTRESLDFLSHAHSIHLEKINVLDEVSSASLVKLLLPDVSEDDRSCIVKSCGQVPFSMRLMCSIMSEENIPISDLSEELRDSTLVDVLDSESFPDDVRPKTIINSSFKRLSVPERKAFVTLAVFPGWFGIEEATALLDAKTHRSAKKIIRSLERKSLIDCENNFTRFRLHSLFQSFIDAERRNDETMEAIFRSAQLQFYDYYIASFRVVNNKFLTGHSSEATATFFSQRESILLSLANGLRDDNLYPKVVEVLSTAELLLSSVLRDEEALFEQLYDKAVTEAKTRQILVDERRLLAAKSFQHLGWFFSDRQTWDHSLYENCITEDECPAKLLCHHGIFQTLCGKRDEGILSLLSSVDNLSSSSDEDALKTIVYIVLEECLQEKDSKMASHFHRLLDDWIESRYTTEELYWDEMNLCVDDGPFLLIIRKVEAWFDDEYQDELTDPYHTTFVCRIVPAVYANQLRSSDIKMFVVSAFNQGFKEPEFSQLILQRWFIDRLSLEGVNISQLEPVRLRFLELTEQILQTGLYSAENYIAVKRAIESVLHLCEKLGVSLDRKSVFQNDVALEFIKYFAIQDVLKLKEMIPSTDFVDLATTYDNLEKLQHLLNDPSEAWKSCNSGIYAASRYHSLGKKERDMGYYLSALRSFQRAVDLRYNLLGDHEDTARSYHSLGEVQRDMGDYKRALQSFQKAADMRYNLLGDHEDTACSYHSLGEVQRDMGDHKGASQSFQAEDNIRYNLDVQKTCRYQELGLTWRVMGNHNNSLECLQKAAKLSSDLLGDHEETANSYFWIGLVQNDMGYNSRALKSLQIAADMRCNLLGDHEDTVCSYDSLGELQRDMGDHKNALESFQKAADMRYNLFGAHEDTANRYHNLGLLQRDMGDHKRALKSLQKAADIRSNLLGEHDDTACSYHELGVVHLDAGHQKRAVESLQKAADMRSNLFGDDEDTACTYHNLGVAQLLIGDPKSALMSLQKAADMRSILIGDHRDTACCSYFWLGKVQFEIKDFRGAVESLQTASRLRTELYGEEHPDTAENFQLLMRVYEALGESELD